MPDRHAQTPISIRPPAGDRAWLESYAKQSGRPVRAVIVAAIARERARQEAGTMDTATRLTDADRRAIARARKLMDAATTDDMRVVAGSDPDADWTTVRVETLGVARYYLLPELVAIIERLGGQGTAQIAEENDGS